MLIEPAGSTTPKTTEKMQTRSEQISSKVPAVTLGFWVIKILATTLGETGGDAVSMSMGLGYLAGTAIFLALFLIAVMAQIRAAHFHPFLYWATIIATTTVGTTLADFVDRSLGIGYVGGALLLCLLLMLSLALWRRTTGTVAVQSITTPRAELFYWVTIMLSQTLGTALGDGVADSAGLGYDGAALLFGAVLLIIAGLYLKTAISRTLLFWSAFIFTRPLGAVVGDFLDKPVAQGGMELSHYTASAVLLGCMVLGMLLFRQRPGKAH